MTRQEMKKLLEVLDPKHVDTRDKKIIEQPYDELAREPEKIEEAASSDS